jgi:polyferredoxin
MTKTVAYVSLIVAVAIVIMCAIGAPDVLSDSNKFLEGFVNHELLAVQAVILSITLASTAQIHLEFNKIEERYKRQNALIKTRQNVRTGAMFLIFLFLLAVVIVVAKPLLAHAPWSEALFNGAAIVVLVWNVLILADLTLTVFGIPPIIKDD